MIKNPDTYRRYNSAHKRFLKPTIENFFATELPRLFGPKIRSSITDRLIEIFNRYHKEINQITPGKILWNAVDKDIRADSNNPKFIPVILTIINDEDINNLKNGMKMSEHREKLIARITKEAYKQGALLSMRDIGLILAFDPSFISQNRKNYEKKNNDILPHTGNIQDVGTCMTHKYQIVYKSVVEKKDPPVIASETNHSIKAVDRYLKDFNRVKMLYIENKPPEFINLVTNISLNVVYQYIEMIDQYIKEEKVC